MIVLDNIRGQRVLVCEPFGGPNLLGTILRAGLLGAEVRLKNDGTETYYPWDNVRDFLVDGPISVLDRVVNRDNERLTATVLSLYQLNGDLQLDIDSTSPFLCKIPRSGYICTQEPGHYGSCSQVYARGFRDSPDEWVRLIHRPEGLGEYLSSNNPFRNRSRTRFQIMEDM